MALAGQGDQVQQDAHFIAKTLADALVPANRSRSIKELFEDEEHSADDNDQSLLPWIKQRDVLFLDEDVHALVVLKTPLLREDELKELLKRTAISVELCATGVGPNVKPNEPRPQQVKDVLSEKTIDTDDEPFVVASEQEESGEEACLFVVWRVNLPLNRPRVKLHKLSVYLAPTILLKPVEAASRLSPGDQFLPSMVPQPINLLQQFESDPRFAGQRPYLSASRITKVAPAAPTTRESAQRIRTAPRRLFKAGPAFFWRIRYAKVTAPLKTRSMFATLEFEIPQFWQCDVSITKIDLQLSEGEVENVGPDAPDVLHPGDQYTVLFKLSANSSMSNGQLAVDQLDIIIDAVAKLSDSCEPSLNVKWTTTADFAFDQVTKPAGTTPTVRGSIDQAMGPDSLPYSKDGNLEKTVTPSGPTGITVTISGPSEITVRKPFKWEVFIVNRSQVVQNLAVFPISRLTTKQEHKLFPPAITPLRPLEQKPGDTNDIYDMPISWFFEPGELICQSSKASVGPLAPSACGTTEMKFMAAAPGVLHVEAVRVVDLATRQTWDIRDLPDIIAQME